MKRLTMILILGLALILLTACDGGAGEGDKGEVGDSDVVSAPADEEADAPDSSTMREESAARDADYYAAAPEEPGTTGDYGGGEEYDGGRGGGGDDAVGGIEVAESVELSDSSETTTFASQAAMPLNAGEIDDNAEWDDYLLYRREFLERGIPVNDVDVSGKHNIHVTGGDGLPVLGARVQVFAGGELVSDTRTYATGLTLFFPNAIEASAAEAAQQAETYSVTVEKDGRSTEFTIDPATGTYSWEVELEQYQRAEGNVRLDVLFLIDATGSMADEIHELQSNILSISSQIDALPSSPDVRYGMVTYRDRGDDYVTQVYEFVPDVEDFQTNLNRVSADGGGDTPESLNEGLHDALREVEWRVEDTVSLIILVADAPPHLDYEQDYDYSEEMVEAARLGIKIHPIASSGLSPQGEYIFRQIAQYTMGHFIFLTYAGGTPGEPGDERPELEASSQDYTVEVLDELVLRLITDELAALEGE